MKEEPLFIKFINHQITASNIIETVIISSKDEKSISIAESQMNNKNDLSIFHKDFKNAVEDLIDNGITQRFKNYVDSYMKPSLEEFFDSGIGNRAGERRYIAIKAPDTPWIEAIICYNLCIFIRAFGFSSIKKCSVCGKFFSHKGKYAKYCSESCKASSVSS
jgi:hypothetical protein